MFYSLLGRLYKGLNVKGYIRKLTHLPGSSCPPHKRNTCGLCSRPQRLHHCKRNERDKHNSQWNSSRGIHGSRRTLSAAQGRRKICLHNSQSRPGGHRRSDLALVGGLSTPLWTEGAPLIGSRPVYPQGLCSLRDGGALRNVRLSPKTATNTESVLWRRQ